MSVHSKPFWQRTLFCVRTVYGALVTMSHFNKEVFRFYIDKPSRLLSVMVCKKQQRRDCDAGRLCRVNSDQYSERQIERGKIFLCCAITNWLPRTLVNSCLCLISISNWISALCVGSSLKNTLTVMASWHFYLIPTALMLWLPSFSLQAPRFLTSKGPGILHFPRSTLLSTQDLSKYTPLMHSSGSLVSSSQISVILMSVACEWTKAHMWGIWPLEKEGTLVGLPGLRNKTSPAAIQN